MWHRFTGFSNAETSQVHAAAMDIMETCGIRMHNEEALGIFKKHGFKVNGLYVHFKEKQVMAAVSTVPDRFIVRARNPKHDVFIGGRDYVLLPGYGSPFVIDKDGEQRNALLEDYHNFAKLNHMSPNLGMMGFLMVMPSDVPPNQAHLDMLLANIQLSEKAFMASPQDRQKAIDNIEMAAILFGGREAIKNRPVCVSKINPITPLVYSNEMLGSLIEYSGQGQPLQFSSSAMAGISTPITLPGLITLVTAEILAGIVLTQLINPGVPCLYGGCSSASDMRTGAMALGGPEGIILNRWFGQMAAFYGIPCKAGGSLTDSFLPDMQAGSESMLGLFVSLASGIHMMDQAVGILASFNAMSYEKFLIDDENAAYVRRVLRPEVVNEKTLGLEQIKKAGAGGSFLTSKETVSQFRKEIFIPKLSIRGSYGNWKAAGKKSIMDRAAERLPAVLNSYIKPDLDPGIEKDLLRYVDKAKNNGECTNQVIA